MSEHAANPDVAMPDVPANVVRAQNVGDMTLIGPDVKDRTCHRHCAVHLAGVDDAHHVVAERDDVHVGGAERISQLLQRLIRERADVA